MPRLSKIGAAALAAFGWTGLQLVDVSYLVVAGGGGGGGDVGGGGGADVHGCLKERTGWLAEQVFMRLVRCSIYCALWLKNHY